LHLRLQLVWVAPCLCRVEVAATGAPTTYDPLASYEIRAKGLSQVKQESR